MVRRHELNCIMSITFRQWPSLDEDGKGLSGKEVSKNGMSMNWSYHGGFKW